MNPHWRTKNVVAICQAMRETENYSACPILADALEDADCDDADMLAFLRTFRSACQLQRLVAIVYSDETEAAVTKIEALAEELGPRALYEEGDGYGDEVPVTYERLMRVGGRWTTKDARGWGGHTTERGGDSLQGMGDFSELWEAYRVITGRRGEGNPFSCTC